MSSCHLPPGMVRGRAGNGFGSPLHLARRLIGSLRTGGPPAEDEGWARSWMLPGEIDLWVAMSGQDRRHSVAVARRVAADLDAAATRPVLAAGLLHDVGKIGSHLGTWSRVAATVAALVAGRHRLLRWADGAAPERWRGRVGRYLRHDALGEALLVAAGSDPLTSGWAGDHHRPAARWRVARPVGLALEAADDD